MQCFLPGHLDTVDKEWHSGHTRDNTVRPVVDNLLAKLLNIAGIVDIAEDIADLQSNMTY